jgi:hypothetical protein
MQVEKHVGRMEQARVDAECAQIIEDLKPGSGKIWKNKLTNPTVPNITGLRGKSTEYDNSDIDFNQPMIIQQNKTCINGYAAKYKRALEKPIAPKTCRSSEIRKRHQLYVKEDQIKKKLVQSNSML